MTNDTPDQLTQALLEEKLDVLSGWREDAHRIAKESSGSLQNETERLAAAMTSDEREAAWELYHAAAPLVKDVARRVYKKESPSKLEMADVVGLAPLVFLRCLASYDPEAAYLSTWLYIDGRRTFTRYIQDRRPLDRVGSMREIRKAIYKARAEVKTREGREPTLTEIVEVARQKGADAYISDEELVSRIRQAQADAEPDSLSRPLGDDKNADTVGDRIPAESVEDRPRIHRIGERLAERWGRQDLWESLTGGEKMHP